MTIDLKKNNQKVRICHLSDIHLGVLYGEKTVEKIIQKINTYEPEVIVITGDLLDRSFSNEHLNILKLLNKIELPIYFVTGNHEYDRGLEESLKFISENTNIKILEGIDGIEFKNLIFYGHNYQGRNEDKENLLRFIQKIPYSNNKVNILLQHKPSLNFDVMKKYNVDIMLSGHIHAGQSFPLTLGKFLNDFFEGLYQKDQCFIHISSGIGTSVLPMRIMSTPKVTFIDIV